MPFRPLSMFACLLAAACVTTALAQPQRQEYHVRQEAGEGLLIRIDGVEADFRAVLSGYDGETVAVSVMPGERLAPRFQYLPPGNDPRELVLEILPLAVTDRSRYDIGLSRLVVRDERSARLGQAYRALSLAQLEDADESSAGWAARIYGLDLAAATFEEMGMEELRGWARYCAAFFVLHGLGDVNTALDRANALAADLAGGRQAQARLATLRLAADSLGRLQDGDPAATARAWEELAIEAQAQEQAFEQAWALAELGRELDARGETQAAVTRYRAALDIADRIGAGDLGTAVREALVPILGQSGDASATGEVLGEIQSQLADAGDTDELARNLLAQGELANRTYRPGRALAPLEQALELERNSLIRSQVQLELARALFALGRLEEAQAQARAAVTDPGTRAFRRATPALDVRAGIDLLAASHRALDEREELQRVREAESRWLGDGGRDAAFWFQRGMDEEARSTAAAGRHYADAAGAAGATWSTLGRLHACGLGALAGEACASARLAGDYRRLLAAGVPAQAMEARLGWARWQARGGDRAGAAGTLSGLVARADWFRAALPGVLDAWLVQRLPALESDYLAPLVQAGEGFAALQALAGLRRLAGSPGPAGDAADDNFRAQLARRAGDETVLDGSAAEITRRLDTGFADFERDHPEATAEGLRRWLRGLDADQGLLTWHAGDGIAAAWLARGENVRMVRLDDAAALSALLARGREQLPVLEGAAFDALAGQLGERLLGPFAERLPERLLVAPAGPLLGLPLDALRLDGRYLAEQAELTALLAIPAGPPRPVPDAGGVFVAGAPSDYSPDVPLGLDLPADLRAVMDAHVGPGLYVVQGGALLLDEFDTPQYAQARLVHLGLPGAIDLSRPQNSALELSEAMRGEGRQRLAAADVAARPVDTALVWLGRSRLAGTPALATGTRLPLVGEWLSAGAGQVVATAWPMPEATAAALLQVFHRQLAAGAGTAAALRAARLEALAADPGGARDWAAPMLFSR